MKNLMRKSLEAQFLAPGMATGKIYMIIENNHTFWSPTVENVNSEIKRFYHLLEQVSDEFNSIHAVISEEIETINANIIETHRDIILDNGFQEKVVELISKELICTEKAVQTVLSNFADNLAASKNEYIRQRANDIKDIIRYFNRDNTYETLFLTFKDEMILVADELFPSTVINSRNKKITGIITKHGSPMSHAAILAKSFGIPVAMADDQISEQLKNDRYVILDSKNRSILFDPDSNKINALRLLIKNRKQAYNKDKNTITDMITKDGVKIDIHANIEHIDEIQNIQDKIKGIGLFRTEFLFMSITDDFPSFEQQVAWYKKTVKMMRDRPVIFRVLDIGGDKLLPYFNMGRQENPFLGLRSHRVFWYHPEILETQIRALFVAAQSGSVKIMYPMVNSMEDLDYFKNIIENVKKDFSVHPHIGIMVETPAAVFEIEQLVKHVDFVSIGTNDLVQYSLTVDRNNENVRKFYQPQSPVIIRMLRHVSNICEQQGIPFSICGEIASDPQWVPLLIGLGFRNLSISPLYFTDIKNQIAQITIDNCEDLANTICNLKYLEDVKNLMAASYL